ncbi:MAG: hypothetical protein WC815_21880 [Vicinamibacterales bacterium]|jgi:hypothetical protein
MKLRVLLPALLGSALSIAGCDNTNSPTSATTTDTTTTTTIASPTFTEEFIGTVPVSGSAFYSFSVTTYGTVTATLTSVSGTYVPSSVTLGLGLGVPSGETCAVTSSINTTKGSSAQLSATYQPGVYCVMVSDVGNLFSAATVAVTIAYP